MQVLYVVIWLGRRILTDVLLQVGGIDHGYLCTMCDQAPESASHMALHCPYARSLWHLLAQWTDQPRLAVGPLQFSSPEEWWHCMGVTLTKDELMVANLPYMEGTLSAGFPVRVDDGVPAPGPGQR